jgi:hypothetical protein
LRQPGRGKEVPQADTKGEMTNYAAQHAGFVWTFSARKAYLRGDYKTITAAATAAGLLKNNANIRRAKSACRNMTAAQRTEFRDWFNAEFATN